jgi:flagellar biogenesis protein FliO
VAAAAGGEAGSSWWIVKTLGALAVVIGLIFVVRSVLGRVAGSVTSSAFSPAVEVLSRVTVAPRNHILLVRLGKRVLVLGDSSAGLRKLADITEPDEVAGVLAAVSAGKPNSISRGFGHLMERFNRDYRPEEEWVEEGADRHEHAVDRARDQVGSLLSRVRALSGRGGGR